MASSFAKWSGIIGLGLVGAGIFFYYREKRARQLAGHRYIQGRFAEAPAVDSFSNESGTTILRSSSDMPIEQRIGSIQKMIEKSVMDPEMRRLAFKITERCAERDGECEAKAIYKAIKKKVRYQGDVAPIRFSSGETEGIDLYQSASKTWNWGGGDCDDQVALFATLASVIGLTTKLRVTAEAPDAEDSHIYPVVLLPKFDPKYAVAADTTLPGSFKFGVEAPAGKITDFDA
jgi:transglutaminase-like putative cysteine protease